MLEQKKCLEHKLFELKILEHWMLNGRQTKKAFFFAGFETIKLSLDYPTFRHTHTLNKQVKELIELIVELAGKRVKTTKFN